VWPTVAVLYGPGLHPGGELMGIVTAQGRWIWCLTLVVLLVAAGPSAGQDLGSRLAPSDLKRFEYDVDDRDSGFLPPPPSGIPQTGSREVRVVRMASQFGLAYLPLMIARQNRLIEQQAAAAGLGDLRVTWTRFPSGAAMQDALLTGFLDFGAGGLPPLLQLWDRGQGGREVRGVMALSTMPLYLNTTNSQITDVADFTERDRIAVPAVGTSTQAIVLQMAAAQVYGDENYGALDSLTVAMSHPQAYRALVGGGGEITAHLTSPPYQYQELEHQGVRKVFSSYDVLGGPTAFTVVWTRREFYEENPRTYQAVYQALKAAIAAIDRDPAAAARTYILQSNSPLSEEFVRQIITDPSLRYSVEPVNTMAVARFMHATGAIDRVPTDWKTLFFPAVYGDVEG